MLVNIIYTFEKNFKRIRNLLALYDSLKGNRNISYSKTDILRAAVVLTHSAFEDFLRSVLRWKLPNADNDFFKNIGLPRDKDGKNKLKFELSDVAEFRKMSIDELIKQSVNEYLNRVSFNNVNEICSQLQKINIDAQDFDSYFSLLEQMISRRHKIVHQSDRKDDLDFTNRKVNTISLNQVKNWVDNVDDFVNDLTQKLR